MRADTDRFLQTLKKGPQVDGATFGNRVLHNGRFNAHLKVMPRKLLSPIGIKRPRGCAREAIAADRTEEGTECVERAGLGRIGRPSRLAVLVQCLLVVVGTFIERLGSSIHCGPLSLNRDATW